LPAINLLNQAPDHTLFGVLEGTLATPFYAVPCSDRVEVEGDAPLDARRNAQ